jgi:prephenate dehydrogenase/chorismate mutase
MKRRTNDVDELERLRIEMLRTTKTIIEGVTQRNLLALKIGEIKERLTLPIEDKAVEEALVHQTLKECEKRGLPLDVGRSLLSVLMAESKRIQKERLSHKQDRLKRRRIGKRSTKNIAAVIGCSGVMGSLFTRLFIELNFMVRGADPRRPQYRRRNFRYYKSNSVAVKGAEVVLIATPMDVTQRVVKEIQGVLKKGCVVAEISSVKGDLHGTLKELAKRGNITCLSVHPLFGPFVDSLNGTKFVMIPVVDANKEASLCRRIFPGAEIITMGQQEHDKAMALMLSLVHAVNIAFCKTLTSYMQPREFERLASPMATVQFALGAGVISQDPKLCAQIQTRNKATSVVTDAFLENLKRLSQYVKAEDDKSIEDIIVTLRKTFGERIKPEEVMSRIYQAAGTIAPTL